MQRVLTPAAFALVVAVMGCAPGSGHGTRGLVGMSASEAICQVAKDGLSYRIDTGPVVKPTKDIACQPVDGPQPHIIRARRAERVVELSATCPATVGCLSPRSRSSSAPAG